MHKTEIKYAAHIYALALVAGGDTGGAETDDEARVMRLAIATARAQLLREGFDPGALYSIKACIAAAKGPDHEQ